MYWKVDLVYILQFHLKTLDQLYILAAANMKIVEDLIIIDKFN